MKLAEALILRADSQKRFVQLKSRLITNARIQEGDEPAENPQALIREMEGVAERDVLALRRSAYSELAANAAIAPGRFTRSEIKFISTIDVAEIQKRSDDLSKQYRDLDARIQELNWQTELL